MKIQLTHATDALRIFRRTKQEKEHGLVHAYEDAMKELREEYKQNLEVKANQIEDEITQRLEKASSANT